MNCYIDSSVLLRVLLNESNSLEDLVSVDYMVSSSLLKTECYRTLDRARITNRLDSKSFIRVLQSLQDVFDRIEFIHLTEVILERAGRPLGVSLGTLDAMHLVSALLWKESYGKNLVFATHDKELGKAAEVFGFRILGL
jgi:predicted nucleic acid-binding protein